MKILLRSLFSGGVSLALLATLTGCNPEKEEEAAAPLDTIELVPEAERAGTFLPVASRLDVGGEVLAFYETDRLLEDLGTRMDNLFQDVAQLDPAMQMMPFPVRLSPLMDELGFYRIDAFGMSAVREGERQYRNKAFVYMPLGRDGIFSVLGPDNQDFTAQLALAPADADLFYTGQIDVAAGYDLLQRATVAVLGETGDGMFNFIRYQPVQGLGMTADELLSDLRSTVTVVGRIEGSVPVDIPENAALPPMFNSQSANSSIDVPIGGLLVRFSRLGWLMERLETSQPELFAPLLKTEEEGRVTYSVPPGMLNPPSPTMLTQYNAQVSRDIESGDLMLFYGPAGFFEDCMSGGSPRLHEASDFQTVTGDLALSGLSFSYASANLFATIGQSKDDAAAVFPAIRSLMGIYSFYLPILDAETGDPAAVSLTRFEDDGLFFFNRSAKPQLMPSGGPLKGAVIGGFAAALAIPAFQKVQAQSQNTAHAARQKTVANNLRQIGAAAMQHLLEEGSEQVTYQELLDAGWIEPFESVFGEDYSTIVVTPADESISVELPSGGSVTTSLW